jgi:hypothetical protein
MSDTANNSERTFKTLNGKTVGEGQKGNLRFVRPSKLAEAGTTGVVAQGIYEGAIPNQFDEGKNDFKVREDNGDLAILNSTGSLASQMARVEVGSYVRISYLGKQTMSKGKMAGKQAHSFIVEVAE